MLYVSHRAESPPVEPAPLAVEPAPDVVSLGRARLRQRARRRMAVTAGFGACLAFGAVITYQKGVQALDELLTNRPRPVLTPVAAPPPPSREARQIPMNAEMTPVASIPASKPEPQAPPVGAQAFPPAERAPGYSGFQVTAGR